MAIRQVPPRAGVLLEALRGLGYTTSTALADVIDNSIAAGARLVDVTFIWRASQSAICVADDGRGMSDIELERAMRLGDRSPLDERAADDLGRFGLGLKTASFSQARRLTVASRQDGATSVLRWDLDMLSLSDTWDLFEGAAAGSEQLLELAPKTRSGTLVIWETLDRVIASGFSQQDFLDLIDRVEAHLAMVFWRYIDDAEAPVVIRLNGKPIEGWDPFLTENAATWHSPIERLARGVDVQCHVLPHKDKLSPREYDRAAGPDGWTSQQGIYVYRNRRLLLAGGWLGLGRGRRWTKEEAHRLARIRIDIPNAEDLAWKIDVLKSTATPPVGVRDRLMRLAEDTRERARRVFAFRGKSSKSVGASVTHAWRTEGQGASVRYRVDEQHPAVDLVLRQAGPLVEAVRGMLYVLEATLPVQRIWLETAESHESPKLPSPSEPTEELSTILWTLYRSLRKSGTSAAEAKSRLLRTEPFDQYQQLVQGLPEALSEDDVK